MPSGRTQRTILLTGALVLGVFFLVAFGFRRAGVSQGTLSIVGGILAYLFLAAVVATLVIGWRRRGGDAASAAERFVGRHPAVVESVGRPLEVGRPEGEVPAGRGAAQANLMVPVSGPGGTGTVDLVMARLARQWEVLSATLLVDGDRVRLAEGPREAFSEDDD
jgi:membrane protein implicated in regulation of membrane protease activity